VEERFVTPDSSGLVSVFVSGFVSLFFTPPVSGLVSDLASGGYSLDGLDERDSPERASPPLGSPNVRERLKCRCAEADCVRTSRNRDASSKACVERMIDTAVARS
jgi:hypothetical protein